MSTPKTFQAPAIMTRISSRADGGLSLAFATNELSVDEKAIALQYHNLFGYLLFSPNQFRDEDIPKGDATDESKSPSQRLRAVLFIYWKQLGQPGNFEFFYRQQVEKQIDAIKNCLE